MRLIITAIATFAFLAVSTSASAVMKPKPRFQSSCGSSTGVCSHGIGGFGGAAGGTTTNTCQTTSWGDAQTGGSETVCSSSDGSSSWSSSEWADGVLYEDSGSVNMQGSGSFSATTGSSDSSSSGGGLPAKFRGRTTNPAQ